MPINRNVVFNSVLWKFLERGSVQIVSFIVSIILARLLTPSDYGSVAIVMVFINLATVFVQAGFNTALIQKKDCDSIDYSTVFFFSLIISCILYIVLFFSAPAIAKFYSKPELTRIVRVIGISLVFNAINSVQIAYLSKSLLFKKLFYSSGLGVIVSALIGITLAYVGFGIWALVVQHLSSTILITMVMWFTVRWRPIKAFSWKRFKVLFSYGWKICTTNLTISLFINIRSLIIGKVYSASSLAYFDRGKQFPALILDNIDASIQSVMFPVLSIEQDNKEKVTILMRRTIKVSTYLVMPLLVGLLVLAEPLTLFFLTEKWIDVVPFIRIFCLSYMLIPIQNVNIVAIKALGYSDVSLKLELIKKCIELIILIFSVFISVEAIAWGIVLYNFVCVIINLLPSKRILGYGYTEQLKDMYPSVCLSILMGIVVYSLHFFVHNYIYLIISSVIVGITTYICLSIVFNVNSYHYLLDLLKAKIK